MYSAQSNGLVDSATINPAALASSGKFVATLFFKFLLFFSYLHEPSRPPPVVLCGPRFWLAALHCAVMSCTRAPVLQASLLGPGAP